MNLFESKDFDETHDETKQVIVYLLLSTVVEQPSPSVSIVLPTFNRAEMCLEAIQSVLNQDFENFELLIVDDGSSDDTPDRLKQLCDPRVRIVRHEVNSGYAAAVNSGISRARHPILAFQDSDDLWHPGRLSRQVRALHEAHDQVVGVASPYDVRMGQSKRLTKQLRAGEYLLANALFACGAVNLLLKKSVFDVVGGYRTALGRWQDWDFFLRLIDRQPNAKIIMLDEPLVTVRVTDGSVSRRPEHFVATYQELYIFNKKVLGRRPSLHAGFCYRLAKNLANYGFYFQALQYAWKAIYLAPWKWKSWVAGFFILFQFNRIWKI